MMAIVWKQAIPLQQHTKVNKQIIIHHTMNIYDILWCFLMKVKAFIR